MESFILDANYEAVNPQEVAQSQKHLSPSQCDQLQQHLSPFSVLFDGKLGHYPNSLLHLDIEPSATPVHSKPYAIPRTHDEAFKKELQHLVEIGVLRPCGPTEWAAPTFLVPKKDGREVRWISDFRALNKCLKRKVYPLPIIQDVIQRRAGYKYFTKIDLSMFRT